MTELQANIQPDDTMHGQFLIFSVGEEKFGIDIRYVKEIISIQPISTLPEVPCYIKGIINLRGKIIPVIDMRLKFRKDEAEYTDRTCIVVIDTQQVLVGLIVDRVAEVLKLEDENIVPPPEFKSDTHSRYISGIGKEDNNVYLLLDCQQLFANEEIKEIENIEQE